MNTLHTTSTQLVMDHFINDIIYHDDIYGNVVGVKELCYGALDTDPDSNVTGVKGCQLRLLNGLIVSIQYGPGNYSNVGRGTYQHGRDQITVETAVIGNGDWFNPAHPQGRFIPGTHSDEGDFIPGNYSDHIQSWQPLEKVISMVITVMKFRPWL